ncbi:MAG: hypothetical protein AAF430_19240 [Myxococcota bacterium]
MPSSDGHPTSGDLHERLQALVGSWTGSGDWSVPDEGTRSYADDRTILAEPSGALCIRTRLRWLDGDEAARDFRLEVAHVFCAPGNELRFRAISPQRPPLGLTGSASEGALDSLALDFAGNAWTAQVAARATTRETVQLSYALRDDALSWSIWSASAREGRAERSYTARSWLQRTR